MAQRLVITKRIAKHGRQSIIVIPKDLENFLKPGVLTQLTIDILDENLVNEIIHLYINYKISIINLSISYLK